MNKKVLGLLGAMGVAIFASHAEIISDTFDDGEWNTNSTGIGSGWAKVADSFTSAIESGGRVRVLPAKTASKAVGLKSKDAFSVTNRAVEALFYVERLSTNVVAEYSWAVASDFNKINAAGVKGGLLVSLNNGLLNIYVADAAGNEHALVSDAELKNGFGQGTRDYVVSIHINGLAQDGNGNWGISFESANGETEYYSAIWQSFDLGGGETISDFITGDVRAGFGVTGAAKPEMALTEVIVDESEPQKRVSLYIYQ